MRAKIIINEDWLRDEYLSEGKSAPDIAVMVGCAEITVRRRLKEIGILRSVWESKQTKQFKEKLSKGNKGKKRSLIFKQNVSKTNSVRWDDEHFRRKMSAMRQGVTQDEWESFVSFEPYCPKFNYRLKENIRNRDGRTCQFCGQSEILNGRRLSIHHIDHDKMQGCNGKPFFLISLCSSCSTKVNFKREIHEFLIVSNQQYRR